jgi:uridine kinase
MTTGRALVAAEQAKVFVVSVSGTSGAGKSSVIEKAAALLPSATRLQFDDYVTLGNDIATIRAWLDAGAQLDAIKTPGMADDLRRLIARQAIHLPGSGRRVEPADVVVLEEPFGRSRGEFSSLIDFAVFIDAPPDNSLARRLLREVETWNGEVPLLVETIETQLRVYLAAGRDAYLAATRAARDSADLVLDGLQPLNNLAAALAGAIGRQT